MPRNFPLFGPYRAVQEDILEAGRFQQTEAATATSG